DFGRIAAQTAKQVIMQKIREAERASVVQEYGGKEGDIVHGVVQRIERGNLYVDLGRATGIMPYHEQIPGERYRSGERIRAYLFSVEEGARGVFLRLSRSHPKFLKSLQALSKLKLLLARREAAQSLRLSRPTSALIQSAHSWASAAFVFQLS